MKSAENANKNNSLLMEFFMDELKDIYWAETHLLKALPQMEEKATTAELGQAFADHLGETEGHVSRLQEVFDLLGKKPRRKNAKP